jgi:molybdate transport system ATP-binding protein
MLLEMNVKLRRGGFVLNSQLALNDINTGLFGKAGAGKSTVLGLIAWSRPKQSFTWPTWISCPTSDY